MYNIIIIIIISLSILFDLETGNSMKRKTKRVSRSIVLRNTLLIIIIII